MNETLRTNVLAKFSISPTEMFNDYSDMVWRLALTRVGNTSRADDILQEVFYRVVKTKPAFNSREHCKAWLIKVTINCSKTMLTSGWFRHYADISQGDSITVESTNEVYMAVCELAEKYKTPVHLYYYENMKVSEIAQVLGIGESAVKQRLKRAREMLKKYFEGDDCFV